MPSVPLWFSGGIVQNAVPSVVLRLDASVDDSLNRKKLPMPIATSTLREALAWRYATKKFDPSKRIPADVWSALEDTLHQAPSSFGLQPWRFDVVEDPAMRASLRAASWNQPQITDASHLVVLSRRSPIGPADVAAFLARTAEVRKQPIEQFDGYRKMIEGFILQPGFDAEGWTARQVYIALGFFLSGAAMLGVDSCPMEGIDPRLYDDALGLPALGYRTTVVVTAGYRASEDGNATLPKVRFPRERVILHR